MVRAHSTGGGGSRPAVWAGRILLLVAVVAARAVAAAPPAAPAAPVAARAPVAAAHWTSIEQRIEREYFQQNASALKALAVTLAPQAGADSPDAQWRSYYAALLSYRLALLAQSDPARAWPFSQQCVDRLDQTLAIDAASAEALALQSACLALQSRLDPWRAPLAGPLSMSRFDKALTLAPHNPRVLLLGALAACDRPRLFGGDRRVAFSLMRRAASAFEQQGAQPRGLPAWGAAEAFTGLARDYLTRGEPVAARDVLERALLVAPDFTQARLLMAEIVSG